jgi:hypothetical protein
MRTASGSPADRPRTDDRSAGRRGSIRNGEPAVLRWRRLGMGQAGERAVDRRLGTGQAGDRAVDRRLATGQAGDRAANRPGADRKPDLGQLRRGLNGGSEDVGSTRGDGFAGTRPGRRSGGLGRLAEPRGPRTRAGVGGDRRRLGRRGCGRRSRACGTLLAAAVRPRARQRAQHVRGTVAGQRGQ